MTNAEYQQLVDFMGRRFTEVDARLDQTATKEELREQQAETRRHFEVVAEGLRADIRQVAEGHQVLVAGQARIMDRMEEMERELGAMIRFSYAELDRRVRTLEDAVISLRGRVERLEARHA
jgi:hypothetical protein